MVIVIDDERTFSFDGSLPGYLDVIHCRDSASGIAAIVEAWVSYSLHYGNMVDLYLDHDLGGSDTIMPVVDFLYVAGNSAAKNCSGSLDKMVSNIFVHSQNPTAADRIVSILSPLYRTKRIPLPTLEVA